MNFIDLFAGAGGLSDGFVSAGFNPIAHIEMNEYASLTLKTRTCYYYLKEHRRINVYYRYLRGEISQEELYSSVPNELLSTVMNEEISDKSIENIFNNIDNIIREKQINKIDVIIGGPPCQAYSLVGRSRDENNMEDDPRNYLYKQYVKFLNKYQPDMFVFENVPGILTAKGGKTFKNIIAFMKRVGYEVEARPLNASDFGVLQNRRRIIIIGWRKGSGLRYPDFQPIKINAIVNDILRDLSPLNPGEEINEYVEPINKYLRWSGIRKKNDILTHHMCRNHNERDRKIYRLAINAWNDGHRRLKYTDLPEELCTHKNKEAFLDRFKVVAGDIESAQTMMAHISKDGHYFIHPDANQCRSLSVREAARVQSFPDNYYFEGPRTAKFIQIGNAVPPLMAKGIAEKIREMLE